MWLVGDPLEQYLERCLLAIFTNQCFQNYLAAAIFTLLCYIMQIKRMHVRASFDDDPFQLIAVFAGELSSLAVGAAVYSVFTLAPGELAIN